MEANGTKIKVVEYFPKYSINSVCKWNPIPITYIDSVVGDPPPTPLTDGRGVLQEGSGGIDGMDEDLSPVTGQHVGDDLGPRFPGLFQHHSPT